MDRYEEALERAKELYSKFKGITAKNVINVIEEIFPQLKESDDKRIRKWLINTIKQIPDGSIEWETICKSDVLAWLDRPSEENPADKVGDWVVSPNGVYWHIDAILDGRYRVSSDSGYSADWPLDANIYHKFTIQDAKDGDVLSDGTTIFIFKDLLSDGSVMSYCDYDTDSGESDAFCPLSMNLVCSKITPATKEQRDTLLKAMADADYTFDFDKKELKKIEQNPAWSEEDEKHLLGCVNYFSGITESSPYYNDFLWLKSLKDRVGCEATKEWSKEDENKMSHALFNTYAVDTATRLLNKVKSLRPQPKQEWGEEDEKKLAESIALIRSNNTGTFYYEKDELSSFLKSLKDRVFPQPKQEWGEEDETALGDALWCCKQAASIAKNENDLGTVWYAETWLKSLKDRVQPQPKQEWNEEDEKILKSIINDLSQNVVPDKEDIDWLKSIKDRYTWTTSDEDKKMLDFAIRAVGLCKQYAINHQVNGYSKLPDVPKRYEESQNWLKSLKPQSAWRPTDKQMNELERASWSQNFDRDVIEELYDDLKKL